LTGIAKEHGLFVAAVCFIIWDSRTRELRYISIIDKLTKSYETIRKDVSVIKLYLGIKKPEDKDGGGT
jgi:hypothetical protein